MVQSITLQTSDNDIIASDILGRIAFAASNETSGSDAILIGGGIYAEAESAFTAVSNATSLVFATASSESATGKLKITSGGHLLPLLNNTYDIGSSSFIFRNLYLSSGVFTNLSVTGGSLSINTNGQSSIFSTRSGADSVGFNLWIGNGGASAIGNNLATHWGSYNSSCGISALLNNTTGFQNCAFGHNSLVNNTTGYYNSAFGQASLQGNTVGLANCAFGLNALLTNTTSNNSAFGFCSMQSTTTGSNNSAFGTTSLFANTTGASNCAFGADAGRYINSGSGNQTSNTSIYIGNDSRASANGNTNEIVIGSTSRGNGSNTVTIGNSSITNNFFNGTITSKKVAIIDNINTPSSYDNGLQVEIRATSGVAGLSLNRSGNSYVGIHTDSLNQLKFNMNGGTPFLNHNIGSILGLGVVGHAMFGFESGTFFLDYVDGIISSVSRVSAGIYQITTIDADLITFVVSSTVINCTVNTLLNRVNTFTAAGAAVDSRYVTVIAIKQI
jgi:trimeric autotransporter adhesin